MVLGRTAGWALVIMAILMASAEAVKALGTRAYSGLATADIWTLLVGQAPSFAADGSATQTLAAISTAIMQMPAWIVFGTVGVLLLHACRKRARRRIFRSANR